MSYARQHLDAAVLGRGVGERDPDREVGLRLDVGVPVVLVPEDRLGALLDHVFVGMTADEDLWRTLIADAIHGDDDVFQPLLETANAFDDHPAKRADTLRRTTTRSPRPGPTPSGTPGA